MFCSNLELLLSIVNIHQTRASKWYFDLDSTRLSSSLIILILLSITAHVHILTYTVIAVTTLCRHSALHLQTVCVRDHPKYHLTCFALTMLHKLEQSRTLSPISPCSACATCLHWSHVVQCSGWWSVIPPLIITKNAMIQCLNKSSRAQSQ